MRSLKFRFILEFGLFVFISLSFLTLVAVLSIAKTGEAIALEQGAPVCERAASVIDGDEFERFAFNNPSEDDPFYEETRLALLEIKETVGCEYLYTMIQDNENYYTYIIDGSCDPSDEENFSPIGDTEEIETLGEAPKSIMQGNELTASSGLEKHSDWGWQISSYQAIKNSAGKTVGFIGCDFDTEYIISVMYSRIFILGGMGIAFLLFGLLILKRFTQLIFDGMKRVSKAMLEISEGKADLTARIPVKGNNEISLLAKSTNSVIESLGKTMKNLQDESGILSETGTEVSARMAENVEIINSVATDLGEIGACIAEETDSIRVVSEGMLNVETEISGLDTKIVRQSDAILSSSSAIENISSNIQSVSDRVGIITKEYAVLVDESQKGSRMQDDVSIQIEKIAQQSENLTEANAAIAAIAEQTNLLAMNAAIEAAHAGELGKGFGVDADEIRALAETSASQSDAISKLLGSITESISGIVKTSKTSAASFERVGNKIGQLNDLMMEVKSGMDEETQGVGDILSTMKTLDGTTRDIKEASAHMRKESQKVFENVQNLRSLADDTQVKSMQVTKSIDSIKNAASVAKDASERNQSATKGVIDMITGYSV